MNYELKMLRNLKVLYKYTDKFLTIFDWLDASSRLNRKKTWKFVEFRRNKLQKESHCTASQCMDAREAVFREYYIAVPLQRFAKHYASNTSVTRGRRLVYSTTGPLTIFYLLLKFFYHLFIHQYATG